eukprot:589666-Amphidinium_carterae.1
MAQCGRLALGRSGCATFAHLIETVEVWTFVRARVRPFQQARNSLNHPKRFRHLCKFRWLRYAVTDPNRPTNVEDGPKWFWHVFKYTAPPQWSHGGRQPEQKRPWSDSTSV